MTSIQLEQLRVIQDQLIKLCQYWAQGSGFDSGKARQLRDEAALILHQHYLQNIPMYRRLVQQEDVNEATDIETIKRRLTLTDDIFKSYNQAWLDDCDFARMNQWLSGIYHSSVNVNVQGIRLLDDWFERLRTSNISMSYSSGTSGSFSFVPRDEKDRILAKTANICYLTPLLMRRKVITSIASFLLKPSIRLLSPDRFAGTVSKEHFYDFDALFLGFRRGRTGNQMLMQELAPLFRRHHFLYDTELNASTFRCLRRGARYEEDWKLLDSFHSEVIDKREPNYLKLIEHTEKSTSEGQKVFLFGAPCQFKELCDVMSGRNRKIALKRGSLVLFGGGWKSFSGETMKREALIEMLSETFDLPPATILEGYSMTEVSVLMVRCAYGRFHIPPIIEPVVYDEALNPVEGKNVSGTFGFLDTLAVSSPGFIISGDHVHLVDEECGCGLCGPAITEIGRGRSREVKGCGGTMSSITA